MQLNFQIFGETGQSLIIVHGLFGSLANWRAIARNLSQEYKVYVVDQRNHGNSPHDDSMTYKDMAKDLDEFILSQGINDFILCGHSMGGKTAMYYSLSDFQSNDRLASLIVLDIAPENYTHSHDHYLAAIQGLELNLVESRAEVDQALKSSIPETPTRLFLLQSLARVDGKFSWKINVPVLRKYMPDIVGFPNDDVQKKSINVKTLFLNGSASDYVKPHMHEKIQGYFLNVSFESINAGHWLHVEKQEEMLDRIREFLEC